MKNNITCSSKDIQNYLELNRKRAKEIHEEKWQMYQEQEKDYNKNIVFTDVPTVIRKVKNCLYKIFKK